MEGRRIGGKANIRASPRWVAVALAATLAVLPLDGARAQTPVSVDLGSRLIRSTI